MKIEVLGTGCAKCEKVLAHVTEAVQQLQKERECEISKITSIHDIMRYHVMLTPAVVINGTVKVSGRVPSVEEIKKWIEEIH